MALTPCDPCSCIPGNISVDKFKQDVEIILCNILAAVAAATGQDVNLIGINGVAPSVGNGATNTGTLRVTISNDSTGVVGLSTGSNTIGAVNINPYSAVGSGQNDVAAAGTDEPLAGSTAIKSVTVKAKKTNTGLIFVGAAGVDSTTGFILSPGDSVSLDVDNLADISIDSAVNGEGVSYIYLT